MITATLKASEVIEDYKKKEIRFPKAVNRSINDITGQTKTFASKEIRSEFNIKAQDLNKNFKVKKSTWKNLSSSITGYGRGISIRAFGAKAVIKKFGDYQRWTVTVKIKKTGTRKIPGGFGLRGRLKTVVRRTGEGRFPIEKMYGPGVATMFDEDVKKKADNFIRIKFPVILEKNINFMYE